MYGHTNIKSKNKSCFSLPLMGSRISEVTKLTSGIVYVSWTDTFTQDLNYIGAFGIHKTELILQK